MHVVVIFTCISLLVTCHTWSSGYYYYDLSLSLKCPIFFKQTGLEATTNKLLSSHLKGALYGLICLIKIVDRIGSICYQNANLV